MLSAHWRDDSPTISIPASHAAPRHRRGSLAAWLPSVVHWRVRACSCFKNARRIEVGTARRLCTALCVGCCTSRSRCMRHAGSDRARGGKRTPGGGGGGWCLARAAPIGVRHTCPVSIRRLARPPPGRATDIELAGLASPLSLSLAGGPRPPHHARGHTSIRSRPAGPTRNVPALQAIDHGPVQFLPPITIFLNYEMQQQLVHLHCSSNL